MRCSGRADGGTFNVGTGIETTVNGCTAYARRRSESRRSRGT
jgi:hypothetical protein